MLFPIFVFNKNTIIGTINILWTIVIELGFINKMILNNIIMMKEDLFTMQNAQRPIFQLQKKLDIFNKFN